MFVRKKEMQESQLTIFSIIHYIFLPIHVKIRPRMKGTVV